MSRSTPSLTEDLFPQSDEEHVTKSGKKRVNHYAARDVNEKDSQREHTTKNVHRLPSEDEETPSKKRTTTAPSKKKPKIAPITPPARVTSKDLFEDSDEEDEIEGASTTTVSGKEPLALHSVFINKVATGVSKQTIPDKKGTHYIELKVYKCSEIETVPPINRWRYTVSTLKCKTDTDTQLWQHLTNVILTARKEFRGVPNTFSSYFSMQ